MSLVGGMIVLATVLSVAVHAEAASCRGYGQEIRSAIKKPVEALRAIEREAADRLIGLDTRTFDYLAGQGRAVAGVIADKNGLAEEGSLDQCRNAVPPVRRTCAAAARALITWIEGQAGGAADKNSKEIYAQAMPQCERWMGLEPLHTVFRTKL